jgi:enoyl-CoA hydratase
LNIELKIEQGLAILTLNRPQALNALSFALIAEISAALGTIAVSDARALIITGAGERAFCAGADIKELTGRTLADQQRGSQLGQAAFAKLDELPIPSIALVNGYAFGGGCELALACTFRLATGNAKFGLPEIKLGLIPGYGGTQRLPRLIGEARAMEIILTGRTVGAEEALRIGLVNRLVEAPALDAATGFCRELTGFSKVVARFARAAVQRSGSTTLPEGLRAEVDLSTLAFQTRDAAEGMQAFVEKRAPRFEDR